MKTNNDNPKAIVFIIIGMSVFAAQDALIKSLSTETNMFLIYLVESSDVQQWSQHGNNLYHR